VIGGFSIAVLPWVLHPLTKWVVKGFLPDETSGYENTGG
jgi:hypothetical protein